MELKSASYSSRFIPGEGALDTRSIGGFAGSRTDMEVAVKREIPASSRYRTSVVQPLV